MATCSCERRKVFPTHCPATLSVSAYHCRCLQACENCLSCRILAARAEWLGPDCSALPVFGPWCLERILRTTAAMQPMPHLFFNQAGLLAEPQHEVQLCFVGTQLHHADCSNASSCELIHAKIGRLACSLPSIICCGVTRHDETRPFTSSLKSKDCLLAVSAD